MAGQNSVAAISVLVGLALASGAGCAHDSDGSGGGASGDGGTSQGGSSGASVAGTTGRICYLDCWGHTSCEDGMLHEVKTSGARWDCSEPVPVCMYPEVVTTCEFGCENDHQCKKAAGSGGEGGGEAGEGGERSPS